MRWYVSLAGEVVGPIEAAELIEWVRTRPAEQKVGLFVRDEAASGWAPIEHSPFASVIKASEAPVEVSAVHSAPKPVSRLALLGAGGAVLLLVILIVVAASGTRNAPAEVATPVAATPEPPPKRAEPTPAERIAGATTLRQAIAIAKPTMADTQGEDVSPGAALLALWWSHKPGLWNELIAMPDTRRADILKDPDAYRGQRICLTGSVVQIFRDKSTGVGSPVFLGVMSHGYGNFVRFLATQSTQGIVESTPARFCGIAIGTQSYSNVSNGTTIAVQIVGEFDIPANGGKGIQYNEEW